MQPPLSQAQQQLLQAGVHPSKVPGLEGGMEIEIDEETIARHAAGRQPGRKQASKQEL